MGRTYSYPFCNTPVKYDSSFDGIISLMKISSDYFVASYGLI